MSTSRKLRKAQDNSCQIFVSLLALFLPISLIITLVLVIAIKINHVKREMAQCKVPKGNREGHFAVTIYLSFCLDMKRKVRKKTLETKIHISMYI